MVSYTEWVAIVSEVVEEAKGGANLDVSTDTMRTAALVWEEDKVEIKAMSKQEARAKADAEIELEL